MAQAPRGGVAELDQGGWDRLRGGAVGGRIIWRKTAGIVFKCYEHRLIRELV